jgi:hypothetical protein
MDISKTNAVNNSGTATQQRQGSRQGSKDSNTLDSDGKTASASPSTIVKLQSKGKADMPAATAMPPARTTAPSAVKSFTYGVLNLPDPSADPPRHRPSLTTVTSPQDAGRQRQSWAR